MACVMARARSGSSTAKSAAFSASSCSFSRAGSPEKGASSMPAHCARCVAMATPFVCSSFVKMLPAATTGAVSRPLKCPPPRAS